MKMTPPTFYTKTLVSSRRYAGCITHLQWDTNVKLTFYLTWVLLRLIQYKSYDSYSRSELQGQLGQPFAVHCLYYSTESFLCQVKIVLNCFVYFMQCFITILAQHLTTIFLHVLRDIYKGRNSLQKCNLDVQNLCLIRHFTVIFLTHFYTQNYKLTQLYHTIHLTICQVKIA